MKSPGKLLIAIIIVIIILIVYVCVKNPKWARPSFWKAHLIESPDEIYRRSSGKYDKAADLALRRTLNLKKKTPTDHLRIATIINRNILSQERPPAENQEEEREHSRLRRTMYNQARTEYRNALEALTPNQINQNIIAALPTNLQANYQVEENRNPGVDAEFIVDAAFGFAFEGFDTLMANDPFLAILFEEEQGFNPFTWIDNLGLVVIPGGALVDPEIANLAENRRVETIEQRRTIADQVSENVPGKRTEVYLDLATTHTNDPQNSHDVSVNACLKSIVVRLRKDQGEVSKLLTLDDITSIILSNNVEFSKDPRTKKGRPHLIEKALSTIEKARKGERNIAVDVTDSETLRRVWARAYDPRNLENTQKICQAVFDALIDCWEEGIGGSSIVCVNGRTSRILGVLSLLDFDRRNWEVKTLEQYKNDIFDITRNIISSEARKAVITEKGPMQNVARSYLAKTSQEFAEIGEISPESEKLFRNKVQPKIIGAIDKYVKALDNEVKGIIPDYTIEGIKKEALAAL